MKIAFFDCFAGAGGDMILGALLDAGLNIETLKAELAKLGLSGYDVQVRKVLKRGIGGSQAMVIIDRPPHHKAKRPDFSRDHGHHTHPGHNHRLGDPHHHGHEQQDPLHYDHDHHHGHHTHIHHSHPQHPMHDLEIGRHQHRKEEHHHRNLHDIRHIIESSSLSGSVKEKSINIFTRLAEAEAKIHQTSIEQVHFHEVGAMDAIIDVVGGVAGMEAMGIEAVFCSPLHVGSGTVECAHGTLPVPAPATLELVRGIPVYSTGVMGELLTPTGAAILTTLASGFGPMPDMIVEKIGYGSGEKNPEIPNLLRVSIGESKSAVGGYQTEEVGVVETNIDDMNPQIYDYLMEKLLEMRVMDTFLLPVQMKKNRPGIIIKVLCSPDMIGKVADFLIRETTSIGLRWRIDRRIKAHRRIETVETPYGSVRCKVASIEGGEILNVFPEYDDCKKRATEKKVPIKDVMEKAMAAASGLYLKKV